MFAEKNGKNSIFSFNRENRDYGQIKQTIFSGGFFVTNKLIILYGIPLDTEKSNTIKAEEIEKLAEDIMNYPLPSEVLLICVSYKPDKRGRFYKRFDKLDKDNSSQKIIKSFATLKDYELSNFVIQESKDLNLNSKVIESLIHKV
jgi:DNA polymerase III delta subunit